jgi:hypothetical protein
MAEQKHLDLDQLSTEELLRLTERFVRARPVKVRRSLAAGITWLVFAAILLTLAALCLYHLGQAGIAVLFGIGLVLGGLWNLLWGLIWVADRSPILILGAAALIDCRGGNRRIPWAAIRRATLHRTSRNGSEESATLTLSLSGSLVGCEVAIDLANLDHGSHEILRVIGQRAELS